eukprot:gene10263-11164_t
MRKRIFLLLLVVKVFFLSIFCVQGQGQGHGHGHGYGVLVGWKGSGKTTFCNRYDSTHNCDGESESIDGVSMTDSPFFGRDFINPPEFGENTTINLRETSQVVDGKLINALIWMVPCTDHNHNTTIDQVDFISILRLYLGPSIPIIVIFNPSSHTNYVKHSEFFKQLTDQSGLTINDTVQLNDFNLQWFQTRYSKAYRVSLLSYMVNDDIISFRPKKYAKKYASLSLNMRCEIYHNDYLRLSNEMIALASTLQSDNTTSICQEEETCSSVVTVPSLDDCLRSQCMEYFSRIWVFFLSYGPRCKREDVFLSESCKLNNENKRNQFIQEIRNYEEEKLRKLKDRHNELDSRIIQEIEQQSNQIWTSMESKENKLRKIEELSHYCYSEP